MKIQKAKSEENMDGTDWCEITNQRKVGWVVNQTDGQMDRQIAESYDQSQERKKSMTEGLKGLG